MFSVRKLVLPALLCAFVLAGASIAVAAPAVPEMTAQGLVKKISESKGKVVVVNIFASWCPPCREEVPGLIAIRNKFSQDDVVIIGVSVDDATEEGKPGKPKVSKALQAFMDEMSFNFPVFIGADGFVREVGITAVPQLFVYDKKGKLALKHKGFASQEEVEEIITKLKAGK